MIEPALNALAKLFRQTISRKDDIIPLRDEIETIQNYIYIQQIRIGNKIEMSCHIREELLDCKVPKLILQPIVENAIFHGIEPKNGKGAITVFCTAEREVLTIEIEDNGVGMDQQTVNAMLSKEKSREDMVSSGLGVVNVHERIQLMYGPEFGVSVRSVRGGGTQVTLRLPISY